MRPIYQLVLSEFDSLAKDSQIFDCLTIIQFGCLKFLSSVDFIADYKSNQKVHRKIVELTLSSIETVSEISICVLAKTTCVCEDLFAVN